MDIETEKVDIGFEKRKPEFYEKEHRVTTAEKTQKFLNPVGLQLREDGMLTASVYETEKRTMPEDYVMLRKEGEVYNIYEVHRSERTLKKQDSDEERAAIWVSILYKKMHDNTADRTVTRKIRKRIAEENEESARELFRTFNENTFSIGEVKKNRLCLTKKNEQASVVNDGTPIVTAVSLSRAYVVLYNYCRKLQEFLGFCHSWSTIMDEKRDRATGRSQAILGSLGENEKKNTLVRNLNLRSCDRRHRGRPVHAKNRNFRPG